MRELQSSEADSTTRRDVVDGSSGGIRERNRELFCLVTEDYETASLRARDLLFHRYKSKKKHNIWSRVSKRSAAEMESLAVVEEDEV